MDKICKELDKIRKERGMTYPELAYAADLSRPTLDMVFETSKRARSNPRLSTLRKLAGVLKCRIELVAEE